MHSANQGFGDAASRDKAQMHTFRERNARGPPVTRTARRESGWSNGRPVFGNDVSGKQLRLARSSSLISPQSRPMSGKLRSKDLVFHRGLKARGTLSEKPSPKLDSAEKVRALQRTL